MRGLFRSCWLAILALGCLAGSGGRIAAWGAEPTTAQTEFFEKKIRPVLVERCFECHAEDAQEGELRVDSLAALLRGGSRGPAIRPGDPQRSLLVVAVGHGETLQMPPKRKLPASQIADLAEWVRQGAPWPNQPLPPQAGTASTSKPLLEFTPAQRGHWAFQPLSRAIPPDVTDRAWSRGPVDCFIRQGLEHAELTPVRPAERAVLLRRVTFDLTGLPPRSEEVMEFLADDAPDSLARVVDRLLASPRHGERFGRHWLDLARYADSNGLDENLAYANAFRYRDYVIAALNRDKPFARFVQEQVAGDLLQHPDQESSFEGIVATGFLSLGAKMLAEDDPVKMQMDIIDEQIDTLGKCFLGLTLGCARCHDHKYDPVDMHDYYALAGIFKSTRTMVNHSVVAVWQERPLADADTLARRDALRKQAQEKRDTAAATVKRETESLLAAQRRRAGDYLAAAQLRQRRENRLSQARPYGELPLDERARVLGLQVIEAEAYQRGNVLKDTTTYGAGIGVLVNRGELPNFTEYDLMIPQAGVYRLELRYAAAEARPCSLAVNGTRQLEGLAGKVTGSWQPDGQKWFVEGWLQLPAGPVTLRLEQPQFFPHIDKLLIAPATPDEQAEQVARGDLSLIPEFLSQWAEQLRKTRELPGSPLTPWHSVAQGRSSESFAEPSVQTLAQRLGVTATTTLPELAARYGQLFVEADEAWQRLQATPVGKQAERLDDPVLESLRSLLYDPQGPFALPKNGEQILPADIRKQLGALRDEAVTIERSVPVVPEAMAVSESKPENVRIHFRGSHLTLGDEVARRFLRIVDQADTSPGGEPIGDRDSGRLQLANWLTQPTQPLTPRVMANRIWLWHFGQALVRSPDNFGLLGEKPTHPELLDWLARRLLEEDGSFKRLHRELVLSSTYAMSDQWDARAGERDPENRLTWRVPRRRLTAEEIRDALLAVSERIDFKMGGTHLPTPNRQYVTSTANVNPEIYQLECRSIYVPVVRSALYEVFQAFDFADPSVLSGQREATTVAPQALFMMNSSLTAEASRALAEMLLSQTERDDGWRIDQLYWRAYGRAASAGEQQRAQEFLRHYAASVSADATKAKDAPLRSWAALCRAVLSANEFIYLD